jgi:cobalt/nickel transport system permease protein
MTAFAPGLVSRHSTLHSLDSRWKLAALGLAAVGVTSLHTLLCALVAFLCVMLLAPLGGLQLGGLLSRLGAVALVVLCFAGWLPFFFFPSAGEEWRLGPILISVAGTRLAVLICLKTGAILALTLVLLATAPVNSYLRAASLLRVPGSLLHVALLAYRYLFVLVAEFGALRVAVRARGYRNRMTVHSYRTIGHLSGTLLVRSSHHAERVARAMQCRGFDGRFHSVAESRTRAVDVLFFVAVISATTFLVAWDYGRR